MDAKRKPLALMIAMSAKKKGDAGPAHEPDGDEPPDDAERPEHSDEDLLQACEDVIDAVSTKDAGALNKALVSWQDLYESKQGGKA